MCTHNIIAKYVFNLKTLSQGSPYSEVSDDHHTLARCMPPNHGNFTTIRVNLQEFSLPHPRPTYASLSLLEVSRSHSFSPRMPDSLCLAPRWLCHLARHPYNQGYLPHKIIAVLSRSISRDLKPLAAPPVISSHWRHLPGSQATGGLIRRHQQMNGLPDWNIIIFRSQ